MKHTYRNGKSTVHVNIKLNAYIYLYIYIYINRQLKSTYFLLQIVKVGADMDAITAHLQTCANVNKEHRHAPRPTRTDKHDGPSHPTSIGLDRFENFADIFLQDNKSQPVPKR